MTKIDYAEYSLCRLKQGILKLGINGTDFNPNRKYRVSFDEDRKGCIVYGQWMSIRDFEAGFELYPAFLIDKLKALDMVKNGKPVTFKAFKEAVSIHDYGRGAKRLKIMFMGHPKENCFAFYPMQGPNPQALKECYENYKRVVNGEFEPVDNGDVIWGNSGYPLCYGEIYER